MILIYFMKSLVVKKKNKGTHSNIAEMVVNRKGVIKSYCIIDVSKHNNVLLMLLGELKIIL